MGTKKREGQRYAAGQELRAILVGGRNGDGLAREKFGAHLRGKWGRERGATYWLLQCPGRDPIEKE